MISIGNVSKYCKDSIDLIENYEEAVNSIEQWDCHHRFETDLNLSREELIEQDLYLNRPASELIFLTHSEHTRLHGIGENNPFHNKHHTEETRNKQSESRKKVWANAPQDIIEKIRKNMSKTMTGREPFCKGRHRVYDADGSYHYE